MNSYNGYTAEDRMNTYNIQKQLQQEGKLSWLDKPCSICGGSGGLIMIHSENYSNPYEYYPICVECHMKLHGRFHRPLEWIRHLSLIKDGYIPFQWKTTAQYFAIGNKKSADLQNYIDIKPTDIGAEWYHELLMTPIDIKPKEKTLF